ncbi:hypothetical protein O181_012446 [Austropuccinia psidii MF-1]|uniref:Uncharacterized protein n=1 Tax=Austropuccinia psidii MF-1 TaxID=1389203 RepID=A0A9Q3BXU5_9BASI|nr:hypothetical protein [Austropuccinia psidii MF-1]
MVSIVFPRQGQKKKLKNQIILSIDQKKDLEMTPALEEGGPVVSTSSRTVQKQALRISEETERSQEQSRQEKRQRQFSHTLPTRVQDSRIVTFSHRQCIQYGQKAYGVHSQGTGKDEQDFSM